MTVAVWNQHPRSRLLKVPRRRNSDSACNLLVFVPYLTVPSTNVEEVREWLLRRCSLALVSLAISVGNKKAIKLPSIRLRPVPQSPLLT